MKKIIVGISGKAESGKNSFAELARKTEHSLIAFDFALTDEDMALIQSLDMGIRVGPNLDQFDF